MEAPALQHQRIDLLCTNISVFDGREEINEILPVRKFRINLLSQSTHNTGTGPR